VTAPPLSPEEIRGQLRGLGYLGGPLGRFVAGAGSRSLVATCLGVGTRVGALLGGLLAFLLFLGYLLLDRFLLLAPADATLLLLYLLPLGLLTGAAAGLLLGALASGLFALLRRTPTRIDLAATKAAALGGIALALYLALAWSRLRSRLLEPTLLADLLAGFASVVAGVLAAAALRPATLLVLALVGRAPPLTRSERARGRFGLAAALLAGSLAISLGLRIGGGRPPASADLPDFAIRETKASALLLAVDGLDASLLERLVSEGALPRLASLRERSARFDLDASAYRVPAVFWTTVATGLPVEAHGVASTATFRPRGFAGTLLVDRAAVGFHEVLNVVFPTLRLAREAPITASLLRSRSLFDVVSAKGLPIGLVNYWLSHPVLDRPGFALSERAYWKARFNASAAGRGRRPLPVEGEAHPPEVFAEFSSLAEFPPAGADPAQRAESLDASVERALLAFAPRFSPRLAAAGLWGLDTLLHAALAAQPGPGADLDTARRLTAAYAALDARIGRILDALPSATVFLVAFPGSAARPGAEARYNGDRALLWVAGPGVLSGSKGQANPLDLAPTLLGLLGFPASAEMPGRALAEAFEPGTLVDPPRVPTFGRPPRGAGREAFDDEMVSILRALGYL
jgi:type I phosphodiesterase/nucleotide pyrophosphatase